jgi:hypothetical protein
MLDLDAHTCLVTCTMADMCCYMLSFACTGHLLNVVHSAVCGAEGDLLTIRDDGLGGCTYATGRKPTGTGAFLPCAQFFPGNTCAAYRGTLTLTLSYDGSSTFVDPDFQAHLDTIGLGQLISLTALDMEIIHVVPIPSDLSLNFLLNLEQISYGVTVVECTEEDTVNGVCTSSNAPAQGRVVALPALENAYKIDYIYFQGTALAAMSVSLTGLEGVRPWTADSIGPVINFQANGFATSASVSALQIMALCTADGESVLTQDQFAVEVLSCQLLVMPIPALSRSLRHVNAKASHAPRGSPRVLAGNAASTAARNACNAEPFTNSCCK